MILSPHAQLLDHRVQSGAALVVGLIFLLLLSLIGVASMQSTALQERMAAGFRDQNEALQAAEAALREGERQVARLMRDGTGDASTLTSPVIDAWANRCPPLDENDQIACGGLDSSPDSRACIEALPATAVTVDGAAARYTFLPVACSIGRTDGDVNNECSDRDPIGLPNQCAEDECKFMVVSLGVSGSGASQTILQSLYCGPALQDLSLTQTGPTSFWTRLTTPTGSHS